MTEKQSPAAGRRRAKELDADIERLARESALELPLPHEPGSPWAPGEPESDDSDTADTGDSIPDADDDCARLEVP